MQQLGYVGCVVAGLGVEINMEQLLTEIMSGYDANSMSENNLIETFQSHI